MNHSQDDIRLALLRHEGTRLYQAEWVWERVRHALLCYLLEAQLREFRRG